MSFAEYADYDGLGLAQLVRSGAVTPLELLEEAIQRAERHNPTLNAIVHKAYDEARATAKGKLPDGPFKGVPFLIKDISMGVAGWPMTNGSALLQGYVLRRRRRADAPLPRRRHGAVRQDQHAGVSAFPARPKAASSATATIRGIPTTAPAAPPVAPPLRWRAASCRWRMPRTGSARSASRRRNAACSAMKPTQSRNPGGPDDRGRAHGMVVDHVVSRTVRDSAAMLDWTGYPEDDSPYAPAPRPVCTRMKSRRRRAACASPIAPRRSRVSACIPTCRRHSRRP